jgi:hypothetical protein
MPKMIRSCPFKPMRPVKEGWPWDDLGCPGLSPWEQLWELILKGLRVSLGLIWLTAMWTNSRSQARAGSKLD